jgi:hypothetical protein
MPRLIVPSSGGGKKLMRTLRSAGDDVGLGSTDSCPCALSVKPNSKKKNRATTALFDCDSLFSFVI